MNLVTGMHHASVVVEDLPRARNFYEGILGLTPNSDRPALAFDGVWYDIAVWQIHLLCVPNPEAGLKRPMHGGRDRHLALTVTDLNELRERLDRAHIPYTQSHSGRKALFCRDPDDNGLEFIAVPD